MINKNELTKRVTESTGMVTTDSSVTITATKKNGTVDNSIILIAIHSQNKSVFIENKKKQRLCKYNNNKNWMDWQ